MLRHFQETSPYFGNKLKTIGKNFQPTARSRDIPVDPPLTRNESQEADKALLNTAIPKDHGRLLTASSSGSAGRPVTARKTDVNQTFHRAFNLRNHLWHKCALTAKFATIRATP
jgi:hypothetical protein